MNRQFLLLVIVICASILGVLVVVFGRKISASQELQPNSQLNKTATHSKHTHEHEESNEHRSPIPDKPDSAGKGWKEALLPQIHDIATKLPNLSSTPVESMLRRVRTPIPKLREVRKGAMLIALELNEPTEPSERKYAAAGDAEDGFERINRLLISEVIGSDGKTDRTVASNQLSEIVKLSDTALGTGQDEMRVLTALRWVAAIGLRGMPLSESNKGEIELLARRSSDDVLRGTLAGALIAMKPSDSYVRDWMATETGSRAIQGFLVELDRKNSRTEFKEDSGASIVEKNGRQIITSKGGSVSKPVPVSGQQLTPELIALLKRPDLPEEVERPLNESKDPIEREPFRRITYEDSENGLNARPEPFLDPKSIALEVLHMRVDSIGVGALADLVDSFTTTRMKAETIAMIASTKSQEAEGHLLRYLGDSRRSLAERSTAIWGLMNQETPTGTQAVEGCLWGADVLVQRVAAGALLSGTISLSRQAAERLKWLATENPDNESRVLIGKLYYRARTVNK